MPVPCLDPDRIFQVPTSLGGERCQAPLPRFVPVLRSTHLWHDVLSSINGETVPKPKCTEDS